MLLADQINNAAAERDEGIIRVFINYDKADVECKNELFQILGVLTTLPDPFPVKFFDVETDSSAVDNKRELIRQEIERSDIVLLLISIDFLVGECYNTTVIAADLQKYLVPILVAPCTVEKVALLAPLKMLPYDGKPLAQREDAVYESVATEIFNLIKKTYSKQVN